MQETAIEDCEELRVVVHGGRVGAGPGPGSGRGFGRATENALRDLETYDIPFQESRVKAVIASLLGFIVPETLACGVGSAMKAMPGLGTVAGCLRWSSLGGCHLGARQSVYPAFESGGPFLDFDPTPVKEYFQGSSRRAEAG